MTASNGAPRVYALDTGIVIALQRAGHLSVLVDISEQLSLVLVEEVRDELIDKAPAKHARYAEQVRLTLEASHIRIESIDMSDPAAAALDALTAGKTSDADLGEAASIAWATSHLEAVFVTRDASAALKALDELRGRVMGFWQFLAEIVELGALDTSVAVQVAEDAIKAKDVAVRPPLWWSEWTRSRFKAPQNSSLENPPSSS